MSLDPHVLDAEHSVFGDALFSVALYCNECTLHFETRSSTSDPGFAYCPACHGDLVEYASPASFEASPPGQLTVTSRWPSEAERPGCQEKVALPKGVLENALAAVAIRVTARQSPSGRWVAELRGVCDAQGPDPHVAILVLVGNVSSRIDAIVRNGAPATSEGAAIGLRLWLSLVGLDGVDRLEALQRVLEENLTVQSAHTQEG